MNEEDEHQAEVVQPPAHSHGPFQMALNQGNTAVKLCVVCGRSWGTLVMGNEHELQWHLIHEAEN